MPWATRIWHLPRGSTCPEWQRGRNRRTTPGGDFADVLFLPSRQDTTALTRFRRNSVLSGVPSISPARSDGERADSAPVTA